MHKDLPKMVDPESGVILDVLRGVLPLIKRMNPQLGNNLLQYAWRFKSQPQYIEILAIIWGEIPEQ